MKRMPAAILYLCLLGYIAHNCFAFQPSGRFDLSPQDIIDLCTVVDGTPPPQAEKCVYMKWTPCKNAENDQEGPRPCGWYQQTACDGMRKKRDIDAENNFEEPESNLWTREGQDGFHEEVYLGWPNESS